MDNYSIKVTVPGSKSITQRALVAAALADGESLITGPLKSEDTVMLRSALESMGVNIRDRGTDIVVFGRSGQMDAPEKEIFMGNNGTGIRFMVAVAGLAHGSTVLAGTKRMAERPVQPMLDALSSWGIRAESIHGTGCPPVRIDSSGIEGGETLLKAAKSSQFLSAMLLVAPYARKPAVIRLDGPLVSRPYVDITLAVMDSFGIRVEERDNAFHIPQGCYRAHEYAVEGALIFAIAQYLVIKGMGNSELVHELLKHTDGRAFKVRLLAIPKLLNEEPVTVAKVIGNSSRAYEAVPAAIYCYLKSGGNPVRAIKYSVSLGGDVSDIAVMSASLAAAASGVSRDIMNLLVNVENLDTMLKLLQTLISKRLGGQVSLKSLINK